MFDQDNNTSMWADAMALEMEQLQEYSTFKNLGRGASAPDGYKKIRVHFVFAVKHDGRHKARLVADGHLTETPIDSVYSGVVSLHSLRIVIFLAELNRMELVAAPPRFHRHHTLGEPSVLRQKWRAQYIQ